MKILVCMCVFIFIVLASAFLDTAFNVKPGVWYIVGRHLLSAVVTVTLLWAFGCLRGVGR